MKKAISVSTIVTSMLLLSFINKVNTEWKFDNTHSKLAFTVSHLLISDVDGFFKNVEVNISIPNHDFSDAVVEMKAQVNSIQTNNEDRDSYIKSAEFFDSEKYPLLSFKSNSFKKTKNPDSYLVTGILSIKGISKRVVLNVVAKKAMDPFSNKEVAGFKISGKINRKEFNIGNSSPNEVIGDEVVIVANIEFVNN